MIVFDLDGTIADYEHRRHLVDPEKHPDYEWTNYYRNKISGRIQEHEKCLWINDITGEKFKPDWQAFYEACDKDLPIIPVIQMYQTLKRGMRGYDDSIIEIWTGRCETVREKSNIWLTENKIFYTELKMRPIGDYTPDDQLKQKWLDEAIAEGKTIDFVFDERPKVIQMWRRRGIFVFDCNQSGREENI